MAAKTREEFIEAVLTGAKPDEVIDTWAISAGSVVAMVAVSPQDFSKDDIVEAIQNLALRMPDVLVSAAAMNIDFVEKNIV